MNKRGQETTYPIVSFEGSANKDLEYRGMTIRENIAAMAMACVPAPKDYVGIGETKVAEQEWAKKCVRLADALLDELNKHDNP